MALGLALASPGAGIPAAGASTRPASAKVAKLRHDTPMSRTKGGKVAVGESVATAGASPVSRAFRGTGRRSGSTGVSFARRFPKGVTMLDSPARGRTAMNIVGVDGRRQITRTTDYPHRAQGIVTFTAPNGVTYGCTAFLYAPNTIGTAGNCVYMHNEALNVHGWNRDFVFYPGKNGSANPYGSCGYAEQHVMAGWAVYKDADYAYAAIRLNCTIGNTTGWLALEWRSAIYSGDLAILSGYPNDKPWGTVWEATGEITYPSALLLYHGIDVSGQTGSALRIGSNSVIGIQVVSASINMATRITEQAAGNLLSWRS
ncbi:trypsin-like serine peptidase [Thermomonospora umbrina]|nr:hypothetical protein [Thermomonospora umbrina]